MSQEHPKHALKFDEVRDGPIALSPEEHAVYLKQASALGKLLADNSIVAKYKLEVLFGKERSMTKPTPGALSFWASGTRMHGGGDEKIYLCPGQQLLQNGCEGFLVDTYNTGTGIICPKCGTTWKHEQVIGELFLNLPMQKWAEVLYRFFRRFEYQCDVYLKYAAKDLRTVALNQAERATWKGTQRLVDAREKRARSIYPLRNILKDASAGADPLNRFYAFLVA